MHLLCVGISHHTAPVAVREKLALDAGGIDDLLRRVHDQHPTAEAAAVSTCNRLEIYIARPLHGHPRLEQVIALLADRCRIDPAQLGEALYHRDNEAAVRHLFRVAGGLDSMVLGENQIVGQVKAAYDAARRAGTCGRVLHRLFQGAMAASKQVRATTGIGAGRLSVASAAVDFARHLFADLHDKTVLAIGAGRMVELTLRHFVDERPKTLLVANRSPDAARALAAQYGGEARSLDQLDNLLTEADVVISSTGSDRPIACAAQVGRLVHRRGFRPLFVIDIALPRDFEPAVGDLANVYLYNLDDLQQVVEANQSQRSGEVRQAEAIIEQAVASCYTQVQTDDFGNLVRRLRRELDAVCRAEAERAGRKLQHADPAEQQRIVDELAHRLVNKILHRPLSALGKGTPQQAALYATALRRVFDLGAVEDLAPPESPGQSTPPTNEEQP